jgi:hypothetical protein
MVAQGRSLISDPDPYHSDYKVSVPVLDAFYASQPFSDSEAWQELEDVLCLDFFKRYLVPSSIRLARSIIK